MAEANLLQSSFLGGEWSETAQGRVDIQQYRTAMNVCFNSFPTITGAWTVRSGTLGTDPTRLGAPGRVVKFDVEQATPYVLEFTDGWLRFRSPYQLATTNDDAVVTAVETFGGPSFVQLASAVTWQTGNAVRFNIPGTNAAAIQNRRFIVTMVGDAAFEMNDEITGAAFDATTVPDFQQGTVSRIQELPTPYASGSWENVRVIQAETNAVLVGGGLPPQFLQATFQPGQFATFTIEPGVFLDGPYLDEFTNGVRVTPGGVSGNITLTLVFQAYSSTIAYPKGSFVVDSSINYISLQDNNVDNTPASSPTFWATTSAGAAINNGQGWLATDVGRLVRLFSEPEIWDATVTYAENNVVTYNPTGIPGANQYWVALVGTNTGNIPGNDPTHWAIATNAALWSWGKITGIGTLIAPDLSGVAQIGDLTANGGLAAAFDGNTTQTFIEGAAKAFGLRALTGAGYIGQNYSGASAQAISLATIFPSIDQGFVEQVGQTVTAMTFNLRASNTAPVSGSNGTLLGTSTATKNLLTAVTVQSNDQVSTWNYVWWEVLVTLTGNGTPPNPSALGVAEVQFFSPAGTGSGAVVNMEVLGAPLLYTTPIVTWQLGVYTANVWPTCGTYHEGRLWLGGAVPNRFDASVAGDPNLFNMAPTEVDGTVTGASGLSYTLLGPSTNPMFWMQPDQQGILCGTQAGEWLVQATTQNDPLSALNIQAHQVTSIGSLNAEPRRTEHTLVFIQRYRRRLMEYFADVFSGKFSAPDIAAFAKHATKPLLMEIAYQQDLTPVVWSRLGDGTFAGVTYKRDSLTSSQGPTYAGWHRHALGSGRLVTSITVGPSASGNLDALFMVTQDPVTNINYVEQMQEQFNENIDDITQGWFLDSATPANGTTVSSGALVASGFWYLGIGNTVHVTVGGLDLGTTQVQVGGTLNLLFGSDPARLFTPAFIRSFGAAGPQVLAGSLYMAQGQIVTPVSREESGARSGPAIGRKKRGSKYALKLVGAQGLYIGGNGFDRMNVVTMTPGADYSISGQPLAPNVLKYGYQVTTLTDDYGFDNKIAWQVVGPYPATIALLAEVLQTQG